MSKWRRKMVSFGCWKRTKRKQSKLAGLVDFGDVNLNNTLFFLFCFIKFKTKKKWSSIKWQKARNNFKKPNEMQISVKLAWLGTDLLMRGVG